VATIFYARVSTAEQTIEHQLAHAKGATGLKRQTLYRIKDDPAGAEAALVAWGM
jgi:hypothetical protein